MMQKIVLKDRDDVKKLCWYAKKVNESENLKIFCGVPVDWLMEKALEIDKKVDKIYN